MTDAQKLLEATTKALFRTCAFATCDFEHADEDIQESYRVHARAALSVAIEAAAKVAREDTVRVCPYGNDKPGDPTWNHTDEDVCPVCKKNGHESLQACVGIPKNRIEAAIRALIPKEPT
jgi:hypothetical protein